MENDIQRQSNRHERNIQISEERKEVSVATDLSRQLLYIILACFKRFNLYSSLLYKCSSRNHVYIFIYIYI